MRLETPSAYHFFREEWASYEQLYEAFEWEIPNRVNTAEFVCDRWVSEQERVALFEELPSGEENTFTFRQLRDLSNQLAHYLVGHGVERGDRVAVSGAPTGASMVGLLAAWKVGAIAVPISTMAGSEGLEYRLRDSSPTAFVAITENARTFEQIDGEHLAVDRLLTFGGDEEVPCGEKLCTAIRDEPAEFDTTRFRPEQPATIHYTSGTSGKPKGVVLAHGALFGSLSGWIFQHLDMEIREEDVVWVPAEWAWIALYGYILPSLFFGTPVVAYPRRQFDPKRVLELIEKYDVTYFQSTPTACRMLRNEDEGVAGHDFSSVRAISLGGEQVAASLVTWLKETFSNASVSVGYGQTECAGILGECAALGRMRKGSIGVPMPGREVAVLDPELSTKLEDGEIGELAVRYESDPLCMKEYWNKPAKTAETLHDGWLRTGDLVKRDEAGYFYFVSRKDDVIISSGYRIGPETVEASLTNHPAVVDTGVIGVSDETRGEIPKAFVVLADDYEPSETLKTELQNFVKDQLAKYEYPRELSFVDDLPTTSTDKLRRSALRGRDWKTDS